MKANHSTSALASRSVSLPEGLSPALEPVVQELARSGETVREVRAGPSKPAAEFLDIETVRLRLARAQRGQPLPGQAQLVERLRALPADRQITYVILGTAAREAKCYVDTESQQLLGVLWLPGAGGDAE